MKTKLFSIILLAVLFLASCSSDDSTENGGNNQTDGFSWKENGGALKTTTKATFSTQYKTFMVKDEAGTPVFEINLDGTSAAIYTVGNSVAFTYIASNPFYIATGGSITIASNSAGKVSGSFTTTGSGNGITSIEGTFTNIEVVP